MARKKIFEAKEVGELLPPREVAGAPVLAAAEQEQEQEQEAEPMAAPAMLEYVPDCPLTLAAETWRVEKFDLLAAELELSGPNWRRQMAWVHHTFQEHSRGWLILRRLYGIAPLILPEGVDPAEVQPRGREEIEAAMGLEKGQLAAELGALRVLWRNAEKEEHRTSNIEHRTSNGEGTETPTAPNTLQFGDEVLREFGFDEGMFLVSTFNPVSNVEEPRKAEVNKRERDWFCGRVQQWRRMLAEPMAGALARRALMNELFLSRFEQEMAVLGVGSSKWKAMYESSRQMDVEFRKQVGELQEMFPEAAVSGREGFRFVISSLNQAYREYYGRQDRRLVDRINTATEIEVLTRGSKQRPMAQYRFGLNVAIVEAMHGLYDPEFRSQFKQAVLRRLDAGFKDGVERMRVEQDAPLVDLEKGVLPGEGEDHEDLQEPVVEQTAAGEEPG